MMFQALQNEIIGSEIFRSRTGQLLYDIRFYPPDYGGDNRFNEFVLNIKDLVNGGIKVVRPDCVFTVGRNEIGADSNLRT